MNKNRKKQDKKTLANTIVKWCLYGLIVVLTIVAFIFNDHIFGKVESVTEGVITWKVEPFFDTIDTGNDFFNRAIAYALPALVKTLEIITIAITLAILLGLIMRITFHSKKGKTISKLLGDFAKWVIAIASVFFVLDAWGADATALIASAGILTLIIGLGSQSLIADILAGIFIVFESEYQVGDIIIIDGWRGEVQEIGIRTTHIIDAGGNVKIVNNSEIKTIINQTKDLSLARVEVGIDYSIPIEKVETLLADNIASFKERIPGIIDGPYYKGISELSSSSVNLLFLAKCKEADIYQVQRDMNREIKILFDKNDICIPFPQVTVNYRDDKPVDSASKKEIRAAESFSEEEKKRSKNLKDDGGNHE